MIIFKSMLPFAVFIVSSLFLEIRVVKPNGGERWQTGSVQKIIIYNNAVEEGPYFDFYYSVDNCRTWKYIDSGNYYGNYSYNWHVPDDPSQFCFVKVYATMSGNWDTSDRSFTIYREQTGFKESVENNISLPGFKCNPNPFSTKLSISVPFSASVYSITGQLIIRMDKWKHELDTSSWKEGVYIIKSGAEMIKIIKIVSN